MKVLHFPSLGGISPLWGEAPTGLIQPKSCVVGDVHDTITCAKLQTEIFVGYDFTAGQIFDLPIDFCLGLTTVSPNIANLAPCPIAGC